MKIVTNYTIHVTRHNRKNLTLLRSYALTFFLLAFCLLPCSILAQRPVVTHDISTGHLIIDSLYNNMDNDYVVTGGTYEYKIIVGQGYQGTITLSNVFISSRATYTVPAPGAHCGNGTNTVTTGSPMAIMGKNGKNTNQNPITKVTIILDGNNFLLNPVGAPGLGVAHYCGLQVDQGAQVLIGAADPCDNNSGTLEALAMGYPPENCISNALLGGAGIGSVNPNAYNGKQGPSQPLSGTACPAIPYDVTSGGNVIISSGIITAVGGHGAGIGGGGAYAFYDGIILITGGEVSCKTAHHSAGIGSGCPNGTGVINCFAENSTIIALPPTYIESYGRGAAGVNVPLSANLALAGAKSIIYLNDPKKPKITIHTQDYEPFVDIYVDLSKDTRLGIINKLNPDPNFRIDKIWMGRTDAAGMFTINGFFKDTVRIFTDAFSSNPLTLGRYYYSVETNTKETGTNPEIVLPLADIYFGFTPINPIPLPCDYFVEHTKLFAGRTKIENLDDRTFTDVKWTLREGDDFDLIFYGPDGKTEIAPPTVINPGDLFYVSAILKMGKPEANYLDMLMIGLRDNTTGIFKTPFYLEMKQRVSCGTDIETFAIPESFTECIGKEVITEIAMTMPDPFADCFSKGNVDAYAYYLVTEEKDFGIALYNTIGTWNDFIITPKGEELIMNYIDFTYSDPGVYWIHWYGESGVGGAFGTFGPYVIKDCTCPSAIVCAGNTVTFADLIDTYTGSAVLKFYQADQTTLITSVDTVFTQYGAHNFYVQATYEGCHSKMTRVLVIVENCDANQQITTCQDSIVVDVRKYITFPCDIPEDVVIVKGSSLGAVITTTDSTFVYYKNNIGRDTIEYDITCNGLHLGGMVKITVVPCPDEFASCTGDIPADIWHLRKLMSSTQTVNTLGTPLAGDMDNDGKIEILTLGGTTNYGNNNTFLYIFDEDFNVKYTIEVTEGISAFANAYAMADIDRDGYAEIFVCTADGHLRAFRHNKSTPTGNNYYEYANVVHTSDPDYFYCQPMITDFNGSGFPQVVVLDKIYDAANLALLIDGAQKGIAGNGFGMGGGHIATNGMLSNISASIMAIGDVDGDGLPEIVGGSTVYKVTIKSRTDASQNSLYVFSQANTTGRESDVGDGATALADLTGSGHLDVVVSRRTGSANGAAVYVWNPRTGQILNDVPAYLYMNPNVGTNTGPFGPSAPAIGDIDGDGKPEVIVTSHKTGFAGTGTNLGVITAFSYDFASKNLVEKWSIDIDDHSSSTGITLFDFNQDGKMELVFRDMSALKVVDGTTGNVLMSTPCGSATGHEYPIIVDFNRDSYAEIIVTGNLTTRGAISGTLNAFGGKTDAPFAPARKVWNQYAYNYVNINNDLTIPPYQMNPQALFAGPDGTYGTLDDIRPFNGYLMQQTMMDKWGTPIYPLPDIKWVSGPEITGNSYYATVSGCMENVGSAGLTSPIYFTFYKNDTIVPPGSVYKIDSIPAYILPGETYCFDIVLERLNNVLNLATLWVSVNDKGTGLYPYQAQCEDHERRPLDLPCPDISIRSPHAYQHPSCGNSDGCVVFYPLGGTGNYEYRLLGSDSSPLTPFVPYTDSLVCGLSSGVYFIQVIDTNHRFCPPAQAEVRLMDITDLQIFAAPYDASTCTTEDGGIYVAASGGLRPYTYTLEKIEGELLIPVTPILFENDSIKNLRAGFYIVTVTDANNCKAFAYPALQIGAYNAKLELAKIKTDPTACDMDTGRITFTVNSDSQYWYQLDGSAVVGPVEETVTTITIEYLNAGKHSVTAYNECGGKDVLSFIIDIDDISPLTATATPQNMKKYCEGNFSLGSILLQVNGGKQDYRYTYAAGDTVDFSGNSVTIPNLTNGTYDITVIDDDDCVYNLFKTTVSVDEIEKVEVTSIYAGNNPTNCNVCDGSIVFFPSGGSGKYEYRVNGNNPYVAYTDSVVKFLCAGSYTIEVRDADYPNCPVATSFTIILSDSSDMYVTLETIPASTCDEPDGKLIVTQKGGTPNFTYYVYNYPKSFGDLPIKTLTSLVNGNMITGLPVGTYEVHAKDANNCTFIAGPATIIAADSDLKIALVSTRPTPCNQELGVVTFTITSSLTYTYKLNDGEEKTVVRPANSPEITDTHSFIFLKAASHIVSVYTSCSNDTLRFTIENEQSKLAATAVASHIKLFCDGSSQMGSIALSVTGGAPGYKYTYLAGDTVPFAGNSTIIPNLTKGTYYITVIDNQGCTFTVNKVEISTEDTPPVSIGTIHAGTYPNCNNNNGSILLYAEGGSGSYIYNLYKNSVLVPGSPFVYTGSLINNLSAGTYRIELLDALHSTCAPAVSDHIALHNTGSGLRVNVVPTSANDCDSYTGSLFVDVSGGVAPYSYKLNGVAVTVTGGKIENQKAGAYILEVTDSSVPPCTASGDEVWINPAVSDISATQLSIRHTVCHASTGFVTYNLSSTKPYYYQLHGSSVEGPFTGTKAIAFSNLPAGDYTFRVFGCGEKTFSFTINNTDNNLRFVAEPQNVIVYCTGATKAGYIALDILAGTATHYRIDGGTWIPLAGAKDTIKNLKEGTYTIEIKDHTGCIVKNDAVRVEREPSILSLGTVTVVSQPTCGLLSNDGVIMFYPTGGSGLYDYRIMNQIDNNYISMWTPYTGTPFSLAPIGAYRVEVRDRIYNCGSVLSPEFILRDSLNRLKVELFPTDASDCTERNGTLTAWISNYSVSPGNNYYYVLYKDGSPHSAPSGTLFPADGKIPVPGSSPVSYGFPAGEYQIMVYYTMNICYALSEKVRINSASIDDKFSIEILDSLCATCPQNNNGLVQYRIKGTAPYKLQLDIEQAITINTSNDTIIVRSQLDAGDHFLHIWGKCGEASARFTIPVCGDVGSSLYTLLDTVYPVRELLTGVIVRGVIDFKIFGGSPTYKYTITGGVNDVVLTGTTNGDMVHITGLLEGIYKVETEDAMGCKYTMYVLITRFIEIEELLDCPLMFDRRVTEEDCNGGYTVTATDNWDVAYNIGVALDSIRYIVDGSIYSSGKPSSLVGYNFSVGVHDVMVVGYLGTQTDTCEFTVTVLPVTPISIGSIYVGNHPTCGTPDGCIILSVSGGNPGSYRYSLDGLNYYPYQDTICGLYAGNYSIKVVGSTNYNCPIAVSEKITLSDSTGLQLKVEPLDATECNIANGEITVTVTGGIPTDFRYFKLPDVVTPLPISPTHKVFGLPVGEYVVEVAYGGCKLLSNPIRICAPDSDLEIEELNIIHTDCGMDAGEYWFTVVTESEYRYRFGSTEYGPFDVTFGKDTVYLTDLNAGTYLVTVYTDCGIDTLNFTINNDSGFSAAAEPTHIKIYCAGTITLGNIELTVANGTPPFRYSYDEGHTWTGFGGPTVTIPNLTEGFYYIRIMDDDDCSFNINYIEITVEQAPPLHLTSVFAATHPSCTNKGSVQVYVTGGSGEYEYNFGTGWITLPANGIITGLNAGTYNISIRDKNAPDCPIVTTGDITLYNTPGQLEVLLEGTNSATCDILSGTGVLTVNVLNGSGSGSYTLSDGSSGTYTTSVFQINGKPVGAYTIEITDNGCVAGSNKAIISSDASTLEMSPITLIRATDCGYADGRAYFNVTNIVGTAYYQLDNKTPEVITSNPVTIIDLSAGEHKLRVYDDCGEIDSTFTILTVGSTLAFTPTVTHENVSCDNLLTTGLIEINIVAGVPDYQYRIDGGNWITITGNNVSFPASAGLYTVEVIDDEGCTFEVPRIRVDREVYVPMVMTSVFAATHPTCTDKGSIQVYVTGGSGEYEYNFGTGWNTLPANGIIIGLNAGTYNISIRDKNATDCPVVTSGDVILHNTPGQLEVLLEGSKSTTCDIATGTGVLTVVVLNGSGSGTYTLSDGSSGTYSTSVFQITGKPVGEYTIEITDNTCVAGSNKAKITSDASTLAISTINVLSSSICGFANGTATFSVTGSTGTAYYQLNNSTPKAVVNPVTLKNLGAGEHTLSVYDDCGRIDSTFTITTTGSTLAFIPTVTHENVSCDNVLTTGAIEIDIADGVPDYQYRIDGGSWINVTGNNVSFPASSGLYTIEVKDDDGCTFEVPRIRVDREEYEPMVMTSVFAATHPSCTDQGSIQVYVTGGSGEYEYNYGTGWNTLPANCIITGLNAGSYNISIRDINATDCPVVTSGDIMLYNTPGELTVSLEATKSATCDMATGTGVLSVSVTNSIGNGTYILSDGTTGSYSTSEFQITGKPVGEYTIEIMEIGCVAGSNKARITSDASTLAISTINVIPSAVCGFANGTASFSVTGNTGTAYYQLNNTTPVVVANPVTLKGLGAGVHKLHLYDDCGSIDTTFTITTTGSTLAFTPTITDELADCEDNLITGNIEFAIVPGIPDYQYRIDGGNWINITATPVSFPASSGLYTVEVKDNNGCTFGIPRIRVDREEEICDLFDCELIEDKTVTEDDCGAGYLINADWDADFATITTIDSIRYIVNDVIYSSGKTASLSGFIFDVGVSKVIVVGYKKSVTDTCEFEVTVLPVTPITIGTIHVDNHPTCGNADGCIVLYAEGGISSTYRYTLNGTDYYPLQDTICGLSAGTYRFEVIGSTLYNCPVASSETITLSDISDLRIKVETVDASSCSTNDGELIVTVTGGLPTDYKYYKLPDVTTPLSIPSSYHPTGLAVGEYVVQATYGACKVFSDPVKISAPDSDLEIYRLKTIDTDCGIDTGEFWFTVATASAYKYRYGSNEYGPFNVTFDKDTVYLRYLSSGDYLVKVLTDCGIDSLHFTINNSSGFSAKETHTHVKVYCDEMVILGSINLTVTGGTSPYWYSYDNGKTWTQFSGPTVTIPNLKEGYYYLLIKDADDCLTKIDYVNITKEYIAPPTLTSVFAATHPSCTDKGSIQVHISGGTGDYQYSINGGTTYTTLPANGIIPNLNSGGYYILLRDANATVCPPVVSGEIKLFNPPLQLAVTVTPTPSHSCNLNSGNGTLIVTVLNGSGSGFYKLNGGASTPYTSSTFTITNKPVGEYVIEVTEGGCVAGSEKVRITSTGSTLALFAISVTKATECGFANGTATFSATGINGTAWYQLDNNKVVKITSSPFTISGLGAGVHSLRVFDNCGEKTTNFMIATQGSTLSFKPTVTNENGDCAGMVTTGNIKVNITNGVAPYRYRIDGGNWLNVSGNEVEFSASAGLYTIEVIDDAGCIYVVTRIRVDRENDVCDLLDCSLLTDRFAVEDAPYSCRYTHSGTEWDIVPLTPIDSIHYYINGTLTSTGGTLDGAIFPVGVSEVTVIAYYRKAVDSCSFTVFVERLCPYTVDDTDPVPHTYTVTKVAGLCWTSNLRAKEYSDGSAIAFAKPYQSALYPDVAHHDSIFGLLYTWYSAVGVTPEGANTLPVTNAKGFVQGICPEGWHIPTQAEFKELEIWTARDLKSTEHWIVPGSNLSDYDSRGAGKYSAAMGGFTNLYGFTGYWASDAGSGHTAPYISITYFFDNCEIQSEQASKLDGLSVRCVWDVSDCE